MSESTRLPRSGGTYVLLCEAVGQARIQIGRLGTLTLCPGWYAYVGSAFGPGGLNARVGRHLRRDKPLRWHFDYLRPYVALRAAWYMAGQARCESHWATKLARLPGAAAPLSGFGASDHPGASHLFAFAHRPTLLDFSAGLAAGNEPCGEVRELLLQDSGR
ncbi:MAG: GIY-YIG nuclease family protein [Acidihalobacter sp.]|uniref:GIY-YIG nuclease family protein n=1 Tax=Acidihalobacter sp. TaxID=1872108 RepID=UPI00307D4C2C